MKRLVFVIATIGALTSCATTQTTQANDEFKKDTLYTASFPCMSMDNIGKKVIAAIEADCKRYDKEARFGEPRSVQCTQGVQVTIPYVCAAKEEAGTEVK